MEIIARKISFSHFLLMFGYKLFSLYFPLFLSIEKGMSFSQVGYTYLFIYLPLAVFSPVSAFLCSRFKEKILIILGICGYFFYSLGMIFNVSLIVFYLFQIFLGISASLFFVASKSLLFSLAQKPKETFGWFYSAPAYADALAPAAGALIIWQFGFIGVFVFSFAVHFLNIFYSANSLKNTINSHRIQPENLKKIRADYSFIFKNIKNQKIIFLLSLVFLTIILIGIYRAFFVLYLQDELFWTREKILLFVSLTSLFFVPLSWKLIKIIDSQKDRANIIQGSLLKALVTIILGLGSQFMNFFYLFFLEVTKGIASLMISSGRSGYFAEKFKKYPEEASAIDTVFSPLGVAVGSLIGGLLLKSFSFAVIFQWFGVFLLIITLLVWFFTKKE